MIQTHRIDMVIFIIIITFAIIELSIQSTCYNSRGQLLCDRSKCEKNLKCKGNIAKDYCHCCDECMKQEEEICGGRYNRFGTCDFNAPYCEKLPSSIFSKCISLKKGLKLGIPAYVQKLSKCIYSHQYKKKYNKHPVHCFLKSQQPAFYCRKKIVYDSTDCCLHSNGCHPNRKLYDKLDAVVLYSTLLQNI